MLLLFALLFFFFVIFLLFRSARSRDSFFPFYAVSPVSRPEQVFYWRLVEALPDLVVLPQVGLSRFLSVRRGHNVMHWNNRINRMSVDFLVCRKDFSIVAALELDDRSHRRLDRVKADRKKNAVLDAASVRLFRFQAVPSVAEIRQAFQV